MTSGGSFSGPLGGLDLRLGVQINKLIGVYAQPSLAFGSLCQGAICGATGTAGVSGLVDFTFIDRIFVAAGGGVGVLNNPVGPEIHIRVGGYPLMGFGANGYTRKGLMVGVDTRIYFINNLGSDLTVMQVMGAIGYEIF